MTDFELIAVVLLAVVSGVLCTLLVQWAVAIRTLSRELGETSRRVSELIQTVQPIARRAERLTKPLEGSGQDVALLAQAVHNVSLSAAQLAQGMQKGVAWASVLGPVITAVIERVRAHRDETQEADGAGQADDRAQESRDELERARAEQAMHRQHEPEGAAAADAADGTARPAN